MKLDYSDIKQKADNIHLKNQAFINGDYMDAISGKTFSCITPINGKVITKVSSCDKKDVDLAVSNAKKTFESGIWSKRSPTERKHCLLKFADLLEKHHFDLALIETLDMGKPIHDSYTSDIPGTIAKIRWIAECTDKLYDELAPTPNNVIAMMTREPCGVVAAVTPWNFPLYIACGKIAAALAVGNSVIIKPAEQSPLTTIKIAELAVEADIPPGVLNVIPGFGETAGQAIGRHQDVNVVSFTGSTEVGKLFLQYSAESNMKRIYLECGGKSPNIVFADCPNMEFAAERSARVFHNQGQICCAPTRLLVENKVKDKFIESIIEKSKTYEPKDPLNPNTKLGAMVDKTQLSRVLKYIASGRKEGAELMIGGDQVNKESNGFYMEPTLFNQVKNNMKIAQEEIFGPVLSVIGFSDPNEAVKIANDTTYGLAASLWTQDINKAHNIAKALRAGVVSVNTTSTGDFTTTFGGYKQSGIGREGSLHEFECYTEMKTTWIQLSN